MGLEKRRLNKGSIFRSEAKTARGKEKGGGTLSIGTLREPLLAAID